MDGIMNTSSAALALLLLQILPALAQQDPFGARLEGSIGSGLGSALQSGLGGGITSSLGIPSRTMADPFNPSFNRQGGADGSCAPGQVDPDRTGCRPAEWLRFQTLNANRQITYSGGGALQSSVGPDPNRIQTYSGDSAFR